MDDDSFAKQTSSFLELGSLTENFKPSVKPR